MGKVIIVIATIIAVVLGGYFVAVRINPALAGGDVAQQSVENEVHEAMTGRVEVAGNITPLSEQSQPGFFLLRVAGEGYLPIVVDQSLGLPGLNASVVLEVPADFDAADDPAELYSALRSLADETGEPFRVIEYAN